MRSSFSTGMARAVLVLVLTPALCGCGTIMANLGSGANENYAGVKYDREMYYTVTAGLRDGTYSWPVAVFVPLALIDVPFSAVADTIILPYTAHRARQQAQREAQQGKGRRPSEGF